MVARFLLLVVVGALLGSMGSVEGCDNAVSMDPSSFPHPSPPTRRRRRRTRVPERSDIGHLPFSSHTFRCCPFLHPPIHMSFMGQ